MLDYRTSELYQMLVRQGVAKLPAGTDSLGIKARERSTALHPELRQREDTADLKLIWNNPNMTKRAQRSTSAHLAIFE